MIAGARPVTPVWMKWAAAAGLVISLGLGSALVWVLVALRRPIVETPPVAANGTKSEDAGPLTILADSSGQRGAQPAAKDPGGRLGNLMKRVKPTPTTPTAPTKGSEPVANGASGSLSNSQKNLASLYAEQGSERAAPREVGGRSQAGSGGGGGQVSQEALGGVVRTNKRTITACYEQALKHDSTLKSARLTTHVKIGISGSVTGVNIDQAYAGTEVGTCIVKAVKHWHFPPSDSEYEFPLVLTAAQ
jgi:hypothetical protein